jgi:hypothetical protein
MEATCSSETMVDIQPTIERYMPEDTVPLSSLKPPHVKMDKETCLSHVIANNSEQLYTSFFPWWTK